MLILAPARSTTWTVIVFSFSVDFSVVHPNLFEISLACSIQTHTLVIVDEDHISNSYLIRHVSSRKWGVVTFVGSEMASLVAPTALATSRVREYVGAGAVD
jgi:hypothetical protein